MKKTDSFIFKLSILLFLLCKSYSFVKGEDSQSQSHDEELNNDSNGTATATDYENVFSLKNDDNFPLILEESEENGTKSEVMAYIRNKRGSGVHSMLLSGERPADIENLTLFDSRDFVTRLQEKYEYTHCSAYLTAVEDVENQFFQHDETLVYPMDGDAVYKEVIYNKTKSTITRRYRLHGESCNWENEVSFWREMFRIGENDTTEYHKQSMNSDDSNSTSSTSSRRKGISLRRPKGETMRLWNDVWIDFQDKAVCNQKLLLECNKYTSRCGCRTNGIGLTSLFKMEHVRHVDEQQLPLNLTTIRHFYDSYKVKNGNQTRIYDPHPDVRYKYSKKCVVTASLPILKIDHHMHNPCDLFLPMIGVCTVQCVDNATCITVSEDEKRESLITAEKDLITRIKKNRIRDIYHNRCQCKPGMICRYVGEDGEGGADSLTLPLYLTTASLFFSLMSNSFVRL